MNTPPLVEKAETYLNLQLTHLGHVTAPDSAPPFVTLCRLRRGHQRGPAARVGCRENDRGARGRTRRWC